MAIQKQFVVRYRGQGHVRFQIPEVATQAETVKMMVDGISAIHGVSAVSLFRRSKKLSIHYQESDICFIDLARQFHGILAELEQQGCFAIPTGTNETKKGHFNFQQKFKDSKFQRWLDEKMLAAKETAQAALVIGKISSKGPKALISNPEKAIIDFLNDILVLYLIKVHWTRITQQWLVKPFVHRYEWLATFYLFFLLVRSRKSK